MNRLYFNFIGFPMALFFMMTLIPTFSIAQGCLDAGVYIGSEDNAHFIRGDETRAHGWTSNTSSATVDFNSRWVGLDSWTGIDAAYNLSDGRIIAYRGSETVVIDAATKTALGNIVPITAFIGFLPAHFLTGIDAVFAWPIGNNKMSIFFFKGTEYVKVDFDLARNAYENARAPATGGWGGVLTTHFTEGIDAAFYYPPSNKVYFFRGNQYIRYDGATGMIDENYPATLDNVANWGNLFEDWSCIDPQLNNVCNIEYIIPDNSCSDANEVEFIVSDQRGSNLGDDVQVDAIVIYIEHSYTGDLTLSLISPSGVEVLLSQENGINGDNYGLSCADFTRFTRFATESINSGSAPFTGNYLPEGDFNDFNDGSDPNGIWKLKMCDGADQDIGELVGVRIDLGLATNNEETADINDESMEISPNPGNGLITVSINQSQIRDMDFQVFDVSGRLVFQNKQAQVGTHYKENIDLTHLPTGIYSFHAKSDDFLEIERISIQR